MYMKSVWNVQPHKQRKVTEYSDEGEDQPSHGSGGKCKPEHFILAWPYERNQAENGRYHGQENRNDLMVECFQV